MWWTCSTHLDGRCFPPNDTCHTYLAHRMQEQKRCLSYYRVSEPSPHNNGSHDDKSRSGGHWVHTKRNQERNLRDHHAKGGGQVTHKRDKSQLDKELCYKDHCTVKLKHEAVVVTTRKHSILIKYIHERITMVKKLQALKEGAKGRRNCVLK